MSKAQTAQLTLPDGSTIALPIYQATLGPDVIDTRPLIKAGFFTYDPGFSSTASCASAITYIDGDEGKLFYRGYSIEWLAEQQDFLSISYLLYHGELPTDTQYAQFADDLTACSVVDERVMHLIDHLDDNLWPMAGMITAAGALSSLYHQPDVIPDKEDRYHLATRFIATMSTLAAACYKRSIGQPIVAPRSDLGFVENFLHMVLSTPTTPYKPDQVLVRALDQIFTLHADHEQNASTSTVRLASSTKTGLFACAAAGIASLWGPLHGGANEAALTMLENTEDACNIPAMVAEVKEGSKRLPGFGHRVYKSYDPRARFMRKACYEVLDHLQLNNKQIFSTARALEKVALEDEYFISRNLYPNVDFYSGIVLSAIGIPRSMFTPIFAVARTAGWAAHWNEQYEDSETRIGRPRQLYTGSKERSVAP